MVIKEKYQNEYSLKYCVSLCSHIKNTPGQFSQIKIEYLWMCQRNVLDKAKIKEVFSFNKLKEEKRGVASINLSRKEGEDLLCASDWKSLKDPFYEAAL